MQVTDQRIVVDRRILVRFSFDDASNAIIHIDNDNCRLRLGMGRSQGGNWYDGAVGYEQGMVLRRSHLDGTRSEGRALLPGSRHKNRGAATGWSGERPAPDWLRANDDQQPGEIESVDGHGTSGHHVEPVYILMGCA